MEKMVVVLVCVAVAAGYVLSYVVYQPQLQSFASTINNLQSRIGILENRTWHLVYSIDASSDISSNVFRLKGSSVRVVYEAWSHDAYAELTVWLSFANGTQYAFWGTSGTWNVNNADVPLQEDGYYYIDVSVWGDISYNVQVWDYY